MDSRSLPGRWDGSTNPPRTHRRMSSCVLWREWRKDARAAVSSTFRAATPRFPQPSTGSSLQGGRDAVTPTGRCTAWPIGDLARTEASTPCGSAGSRNFKSHSENRWLAMAMLVFCRLRPWRVVAVVWGGRDPTAFAGFSRMSQHMIEYENDWPSKGL